MTKQEHIEAVEQVIWSWLQSHYQESCYTTELGKFTDALCDFWKIYNDNKDEIKQLKAENEKYLDSIESVQAGRCRLRCQLTEQAVKQAKIEVLNKLKGKCHNYYPSIDHYCCSVKAVTLSDINNIIKELIK